MQFFKSGMFFVLIGLLFFCKAFSSTSNSLSPKERPDIKEYLQEISKKHHFDYTYLEKLFSNKIVNQRIIDLMNKPAEKKKWPVYKKLVVSDTRIKKGTEFYRKHKDLIEKIEKKYNIPGSILVSIIGIETNYGRNTGSFNALTALATLGFNYPRRAKFFQNELTELLIMGRESSTDLNELNGSYGGALGIPQFMPSNYRKYAISFNDNEKMNIFKKPSDALASAANYLIKVGRWKPEQSLYHKLTLSEEQKVKLDTLVKGKYISAEKLSEFNIDIPSSAKNKKRLRVIKLENEENEFSYFLGYNNYLSIFRYNPSDSYTMAVITLAESIKNELS